MTGRALRRYVEDLLSGRRPRALRATDADADELRTALTLRAAGPGRDAPREEFVAALHRRLADELAGPPSGEPAPRAIDRPAPRPLGRRGLVARGAALAAASAAVGALVGRAVTGRTDGAGSDTAGTMTPTRGDWHTVVASDELPEGAVRAFDLGAVIGIVLRSGGEVRAVSGICSHQGCRLSLNATSRRLDCPCHTTAFALSGEVLSHQLPVAPGPLPRLAARELDGAVQVYTPPV